MEYISHSEKETLSIASEIASKLQGGEIICLYGELGAGKTTFTKGLAGTLNITKDITSPTFTLMNLYKIEDKPFKNFVHVDTYRLKNEAELVEIGIEEYLGNEKTVCVIEWPEKISGLLQNKKVIKISFDHLSPTERKISVD